MEFEQTRGSRAQVWHGTAEKTTGGLVKSHLMMNKHGRIVSKKKHALGKKSIKHLYNYMNIITSLFRIWMTH